MGWGWAIESHGARRRHSRGQTQSCTGAGLGGPRPKTHAGRAALARHPAPDSQVIEVTPNRGHSKADLTVTITMDSSVCVY